MQDRRLVVVIQGDDTTTNYHMWIETPCDEHAAHVITNQLVDVPAHHVESPHTWMQLVLAYAEENLCLCGGRPAPVDAMTAMLEATRG